MADFDSATPCPIRSTANSIRSSRVLDSYNRTVCQSIVGRPSQPLAKRRTIQPSESAQRFDFTTGLAKPDPPRPSARRKPPCQFSAHPLIDRARPEPPRTLLRPPYRKQPVVACNESSADSPIRRQHAKSPIRADLRSPLKPRSPNTSSPVRSYDFDRQYLAKISVDLTQPSHGVSRQARRRTIFVPSDVITIPSIDHEVSVLDSEYHEVSGGSRTRRPRLIETCHEGEGSGLRATVSGTAFYHPAPTSGHARRRPLMASRIIQSNSPQLLLSLGADVSKENVPPGWIEDQLAIGNSCAHQEHGKDPGSKPEISHGAMTPLNTRTAELMQKLSSQKKRPLSRVQCENLAKVPRRNSRLLSFSMQSSPIYPSGQSPHQQGVDRPICDSQQASSPLSITRPIMTSPISTWAHGPPRSHGSIADSGVHQEHWREHQETSIVQLLNTLLKTDRTATFTTSETETEDLQVVANRLWQQQQLDLPMKRVDGAMRWGTLALTRRMIPWIERLEKSPVHRKVFVQFWLSSYPIKLVQMVLLYVVGVPLPAPAIRVPETASTSFRRSIIRQSIEEFIIDYLIGNKDAEPRSLNLSEYSQWNGEEAIKIWGWQRTTRRCLMMILLLDQLKIAGHIQKNLFQRQSSCKSSAAVVSRLAEFLLPTTKHPLRSLTQLGYTVSHEQSEVDEYAFEITNLAVDLRDGVRLHRLICNLGQHPHGTQSREAVQGSRLYHKLSEKIGNPDPCADVEYRTNPRDRRERLLNVSHVISCLRASNGPGHPRIDIRAEDIVDGYREKTIDFLWNALEGYGTSKLIDREFLLSEVLQHQSQNALDVSPIIKSTDYELLRRWARVIASAAGDLSHDSNTCFNSSAIFEALIDHYAPSFPIQPGEKPLMACTTLHQKLRSLGASGDFAAIFGCPAHSEEAYDHKFVTAALLFLASALLPHLRRERAARLLQRRWRRREMAWEMKKRVVLVRLARDCMTVVVTSKRVTDAAIVIQRAWKGALNRRIGKLLKDITAFQAMARAYALRKLLEESVRIGSPN